MLNKYSKKEILGRIVDVIVDRPMESFHPKYKELCYLVNYGYVEDIMAGDGEYQDVYILGVDKPIQNFTGKVIAIIHRLNDEEDKWIVTHENMAFTKQQIKNCIEFQEKYFIYEIEM